MTCDPAAAQPESRPATTSAPARSTAAATAPAERLVEWHGRYKAAAGEARKRNVLLLAVYYDPDAPAWEAFEEQTLRDIETRRLLARFAAARISVTGDEGRKALQAMRAKQTPLTQVFTPGGELLDSIPGAIIPAGEFRKKLKHSLACWKALATKPFAAAAQWKAIQARLRLSTREKTAAAIDKLLKLPEKQLPTGVTPAHLYLAKGRALFRGAPGRAEAHLRKARKLAAKNATLAQYVVVSMIQLAARARQYKKTHAYCVEYIRDFPKGSAIGQAYYYKAMVEMTGLDDRDAARKTLESFISKYPDEKGAVRARRLLNWLKDTTEK